jgi:hypothetical protein
MDSNSGSSIKNDDTIKQYYKLKAKYENNSDKKKSKIKKDNSLTTNEKKQKIRQIKYNCVNCGKEGGTLFDETNGMLKAHCNASEPCNLNMNIKRIFYNNARDLSKSYNKQIESLKMRIIITKLDYLFGINSSKEDIIERFNSLKVELSNISEKDILLNKNYGNIISGINRDPLLNDAKMNLENDIYELKQLYKEYNENPSVIYIENIVDVYINKIKPLVEEIRKMKYEYYTMEKNDDETMLVALPYREAKLDKEL